MLLLVWRKDEVDDIVCKQCRGMVDVLAAAKGEDNLGADKGVQRVERREGVQDSVGILPVSASELEEADGDVAAGGDGLTIGDTIGPEWNVGSMLVTQRGLVAASWVPAAGV